MRSSSVQHALQLRSERHAPKWADGKEQMLGRAGDKTGKSEIIRSLA